MNGDLLRKLDQMIELEEKFLPKFPQGSSQYGLLQNRIRSLQIARDLVAKERMPSEEELKFALPRMESILHKTRKARDKYEECSRNFRRFDPTVQAMEQVCAAMLRVLEG